MELSLLLTLIFILAPCSFIQTPTEAKLLYGCLYDNFLCEDEESCIEDGFFGRCQTEPYNLRRYNDLSEAELELLRLELARLASLGQSWGSDLTQCVIGYYFMTRKEHFQFDPDFCNVREPGNILQLIQMAENAADKMSVEEDVEREIPNELPVYSDSSDPYYVYEAQQSNPDYEFVSGAEGEREIGEERGPVYRVVAAGPYTGDSESIHEDVGENYLDRDTLMANVINQLIQSMGQSDDGQNMVERGLYSREAEKDNEAMGDSKEVFYRLTEEEEGMLNRMLLQVMNGENPDLSQLSDKQLDKFITYVELMQSLLEKEDDGNTVGEIAFPQQEQDPDAERYLLKKDEEQIGNVDLGLENREHKIVKGIGHQAPVQHSVEKIDGNRVHIKTAKDISKDYGRLMELVNYLKEKIAKPKNLKFSDFRIDHNEISFTVNRNGAKTGQISEKWLKHVFGVVSKRITPGLQAAAAIANNKRTLDKLVGHSKVSVGSKRGDADFEKAAADDGIVVPTLVICGLIVGVLVSLLGVYVYRNRNRARSTLKRLAADVEGQPTKAYEELCRQRMAAKGESSEPLGGVVNTFTQRLGSQSESPPPGQVKGSPRTSSTSSWSEEPVHITNMDISTGHVILSYLEDHLENKDKLDEDWQALNSYRPDHCDTLVAQLPEHSGKNRSDKVLPYDHARVQLKSEAGESPSEYINASPLYDHDPKNPVYIVTQGPLMSTAPEFWQMIWEQGSVVIVNLTKLVEEGMNVCHRYWPENGSEVYGVFEVHLVSEHIWCEDYLVRSFYLKNLRTNETRTVTQFHFLSWREAKAPISPKSLLEFRRKVNKSYRGRSCPIVVHCSDGSGRSGTYCLLDMVLNRINKGVKEIDIAATLEHLRDQRMGLAATKGQYEFVLMCVAEEVQAIIKALPQQ